MRFTKADYERFWLELVERVDADILPPMLRSKFCISVLDGRADIYLAVQVGLALLLDKPLLVVALNGMGVSPRLRQVADAVVECESGLAEESKQKIKAAMMEVMQRYKETRQ